MKSLIILEEEFDKVVPWYLCLIPFSIYSIDAMTIGHYGKIEYGYDNIKDLPKRYRQLVNK